MDRSTAPTRAALRPALLAGALLLIAAGVGIYLAVDEAVGVVIAVLGVFDLLTVPLVLRLGNRGSAPAHPPAEPGAEPPSAEPDPTYNPYARED